MIERVDLGVFLPQIMLMCRGLPEDIAKFYVLESCIDFCKKTSVLKRFRLVHVPKGIDRFPLEADEQENIARIKEVTLSSRDGNAVYMGCVNYDIQDGFVILKSPVVADSEYCVTFTSTPSREACEVDAVLYEDWRQDIVNGALSKLLMTVNTDFSNPQLAMHFALEFEKGCKHARVRTLKGEQSRPSIVKRKSFL